MVVFEFDEEETNSDYLYYDLKRFEPELKGRTAGSGIPHVDKEVLLSRQVFEGLPGEQKAAAKVLRKIDRAIEQTEGRGRALEPDLPSVLKVTFVHQLGIWWYPFGRNQTVIAAGPGNRWLVIADPSLRYGRVIAREPMLDPESLRAVATALANEGYDRCAFVLKPQSGGREQLTRLCDEVR